MQKTTSPQKLFAQDLTERTTQKRALSLATFLRVA